MSEKKFRWASPQDWLNHHITKLSEADDVDEICATARQLGDALSGDQVKALFVDEMGEDGYFNELCLVVDPLSLAECGGTISECDHCRQVKCEVCHSRDACFDEQAGTVDEDRVCNKCGDEAGPGTLSSDGVCDGCILDDDAEDDGD